MDRVRPNHPPPPAHPIVPQIHNSPACLHLRPDLIAGAVLIQYEKVEKIGEGTYGVVYKALDKHTGRGRCLARSRSSHPLQGPLHVACLSPRNIDIFPQERSLH